MKMLNRFWSEQEGFLISLELILAAIMLVFGMIVGMQVLRDAAAQELADLGMAIGAINNSFVIAGIAAPANGGTGSSVSGSTFTDATDECDAGSTPTAGAVSGGLLLGQAAAAESAS
jgi:hypothetical protein